MCLLLVQTLLIPWKKKGILLSLNPYLMWPFLGILQWDLILIPPLFLLGLTQLVDHLLDKERFKCLRRVWPTLIIHAILDTFQGYYKPKRRIFAGLYFVFRLGIVLIFVYATDYLTKYALQLVLIEVIISLMAIFKPYKREIFNNYLYFTFSQIKYFCTHNKFLTWGAVGVAN